jgi:hypothetical protein
VVSGEGLGPGLGVCVLSGAGLGMSIGSKGSFLHAFSMMATATKSTKRMENTFFNSNSFS